MDLVKCTLLLVSNSNRMNKVIIISIDGTPVLCSNPLSETDCQKSLKSIKKSFKGLNVEISSLNVTPVSQIVEQVQGMM